jgi:hypothetical protein
MSFGDINIAVGTSTRPPLACVACCLIVEADGGVDGLSRPVDGQIGEQFILAEPFLDVALAIALRAELLDDPCRQSCGRVVQTRGQGLWFTRVFHRIGHLLLIPLLSVRHELLLRLG